MHTDKGLCLSSLNSRLKGFKVITVLSLIITFGDFNELVERKQEKTVF